MHRKTLLIVALITGSLVLADAAAAQVLSSTAAPVEAIDLAELHYSLGVALIKLGQPIAALREFRTIAELTPSDAAAHYNLGLALNNVGRHADALPAYREAVRLQPDYADAWGNLGLAAHLVGRNRESADAFARAKALQPAYFDTRPRQHAAFEASRGDATEPRR